MDVIASAPWVALVLATVAVALAVVEAAVPGLGVAGVGAALAAAGAGLVVWQVDASPYPLLAVAAATVLWTLMVGWPRPPAGAQAAAAGLHAAGGIAYGLAADDRPSVVVAVLGATALGAGFPGLHRWTRHLAEQQPRVGMESLVGRSAVVERGAGDGLVVRIDGSLWSIAPTGAPPATGTRVVVRGWRGMALAVEPADRSPGVPSGPS